jgi:hypothetical protein
MAMTAQQDRRRALYDAYCAVPDHQRAEIIDGTLYVSPRPAPRHANASTVLASCDPKTRFLVEDSALAP